MRFHSELCSGDAVTVRSFRATDDVGAAAIAHAVIAGGRVAATALDTGDDYGARLPVDAVTPLFLPRGIVGQPLEPWQPDTPDHPIELGPVGLSELAHDSCLTFAASVAKLSIATQHHAALIGFSQDLTRRTGIGRMLVELRYRQFNGCEPGSCIRVAPRLLAVQAKSYTSAYLLYSQSGRVLALFELCTLAVDMKTRRATYVPDTVRSALQAHRQP
jgi:acyl-CoA thioesterase FadM